MYNAPYNTQFNECNKSITMKSSKNPDQTQWHVLGAGAIGCLWAAHLVLAGHSVTLICRNRKQLAAFNRIAAITLAGNDRQLSVAVQAETADSSDLVISNLLVCTKSPDVLSAVQSIGHRLIDTSVMVLLMNGLGAQQQISEALPDYSLICATTTDGAYLRAPFEVFHAGSGETHFGLLDQQTRDTNCQTNLSSHFDRLSLKTHWDNYIYPRMLHKLAVNAIINPLTVIHHCSNGKILEDPDRVSMIIRLCNEIAPIIAALTPGYPFNLYDSVISIARATGSNYSSMYQDVAAGRPTEIGYINGYLCQQARQLSLPTPLNQMLIRQIKTRQHTP